MLNPTVIPAKAIENIARKCQRLAASGNRINPRPAVTPPKSTNGRDPNRSTSHPTRRPVTMLATLAEIKMLPMEKVLMLRSSRIGTTRIVSA